MSAVFQNLFDYKLIWFLIKRRKDVFNRIPKVSLLLDNTQKEIYVSKQLAHMARKELSRMADLYRSSVNHGEDNGTPLQYSCLQNPMDGGAWWATIHGVAKGQTRLSDFTFTFHEF